MEMKWKDVNLADAQDGLYNPDKAKAEFAKAKSALQAEGVTFPIHWTCQLTRQQLQKFSASNL